MSYFSNNLRFLRERLSIKQDAFEQIGIKKGTYSNYENGKTEPNIETLMSISKFLGIDLNSLICSDLAGMSEEDFLKNVNIIENNGNLNGNLNGNPLEKNGKDCSISNKAMKEKKSRSRKEETFYKEGAIFHLQEQLKEIFKDDNSNEPLSVKLNKIQVPAPEQLIQETHCSVPFYNLSVNARQLGVLESEVFSHIKPDGFVELSVFEGCEAIFPIVGISMEPIISSGDWIGIKAIDNISRSWEFLQTGVIYLIITREERMIKFIEKATDENFIVCKSPNYGPFKVIKGDILKLYRVKACSKRL